MPGHAEWAQDASTEKSTQLSEALKDFTMIE